MTGLVPQNAKLGTGNINHNNERKEKLESSDSDEDSEFIKDKPLKLQMKKRKIILIYKKQESFDQKYAWLVLIMLMRLILQWCIQHGHPHF